MFEKKKKAKKKNEDLMKKAPAAGAVELSDDVLEAAAGGLKTADRVMYSFNPATKAADVRCSRCGFPAAGFFCRGCGARFTFGFKKNSQ